MEKIDTILINPSALKSIYQGLSSKYSAIEPPIWAGMIAGFLQTRNISTSIIDCEGEGLTSNDVTKRIGNYDPKLIIVVVYGQQPSASTQNMHGASQVCTALKKAYPDKKIMMLGGHVSALPQRTLQEEEIDFVCQGEGPYTIEGLLQTDMKSTSQLKKVPGLWFREQNNILKGESSPLITQEKLCHDFPRIPWEMLPMKNYRAHNWHCFDDLDNRSPYASIYTSLGCPFNCSFCCINAPFGKSSFRYWDPNHIIKEFDILVTKYGVKNIKIIDEMFVLKEAHFLKLCELLIERKYDLNIWAYARIDTIKPYYLERLRKAGIRWLVLGIESKSQFVRSGLNKDRFSEDDIFKAVKMIQDAGIYVHGNYIFGLPDDDHKSMQETLDMAIELNTEMANFYSAMAYPGSALYQQAIDKGWKLPESWIGYAQHSYECLPLPTNHLSAGEVLSFRDQAWNKYFTNSSFLNLIEKTFSHNVRQHIVELSQKSINRKNN